MTRTSKLATVRRKLRGLHGEVTGPALDDPFQLILWEQVAYLANDERRRRAFELLRKRVGLTPKDILRAKPKLLKEIAAEGGAIAADTRAERMRASADRVISEWDGHLERALDLPLKQATRALTKFPMIGKPGAEKILLLTDSHPVLALDSNGLRVLLRLGYGAEGSGYDQTYRKVRAATAPVERADTPWLASLHHLLRRHGQEVCRNKQPERDRCLLTGECDHFREHVYHERFDD